MLKEQKFAQCQKAEVLALAGKAKLVNLNNSISTLWLIEPFVGSLEIGDVINFTGYYFMS